MHTRGDNNHFRFASLAQTPRYTTTNSYSENPCNLSQSAVSVSEKCKKYIFNLAPFFRWLQLRMGYGGSNILLLVGQFSYNKLFVLYVDPFQKAQDCQNTSDIAPDVNSCIPKPAPLIMDLFIAVLFATMPYLTAFLFGLSKVHL